MIFIGSTNEAIGSKLIRYGTSSDTSHFAMGFNLEPDPIIVESVLTSGFRETSLSHFQSYQKITRRIDVHLPVEVERMLYRCVVDRLKGKKYDRNAIAYWMVRLTLHKYMWIPLPDHNQWGSREAVYCVEVLNAISTWLADHGVVFDKEIEMIHPGEAFDRYLCNLRI